MPQQEPELTLTLFSIRVCVRCIQVGIVAEYSEYLSGFASKRPRDPSSIHPHCISAAIIATFRSLGSEHHICIGEADPVLTCHAIRHRMHKQMQFPRNIASTVGSTSEADKLPSWHGCVYGILSRDADFAITHNIRYLNIEDVVFTAKIAHPLSNAEDAAAGGEYSEIQFRSDATAAGAVAPAPTALGDPTGMLDESIDVASRARGAARRLSQLPGSVAASSIVSIHCCPLSVEVVSRLLSVPVHRLTELSFLCGNDYSKPFAHLCVSLQASEWRYSQERDCLLHPGQTVAGVVEVLTRNPDSPTVPSGASAEYANLHARIRSWIAFLQNIESVFGPSVPLDQVPPFRQVVLAQLDSQRLTMHDILEYSRRVYEQEEDMLDQDTSALVETPLDLASSPTLQLFRQPSINAFLRDAVQQDILPRSVFGWLSNGVSHGSIWWENLETLSGNNLGQGNAFRVASTAPRLLPAIDSVVRPLVIATALLVNMNGLRVYERRDVQLVPVDYDFTHQLPRYHQELRTLYKRAKKERGSQEASLRVQLVRLQSMPVKMDLLDQLFNDSWEMVAESTPRVAATLPLQLFHFEPLSLGYDGLSDSQLQRLRLPIIMCRWFLLAMQGEVQCKRAQHLQLHVPSPIQLQLWCATFVECVLVMDAVRSLGSSPLSVSSGDHSALRFRVRQRVNTASSSSRSTALTEPIEQRPSIAAVSVFSCFQAIYTHLVPLLTSLDMQHHQELQPPTIGGTAFLSGIPVLRPDELFHGELFAAITAEQDLNASSVSDSAPSIFGALCSGAFTLHLESSHANISSQALLNYLQQHLPDAYRYAMSCICRQWGPSRTFDEFVMQHAPPPVTSSVISTKKITLVAPPTPNETQQLSESELAAIDFRGGGFRSIRNLVRLPIDRVAARVLKHSILDPFVIVRGATGSGKSSRTPALLLRHWYDPATTRARDKSRKKFEACFKGELHASLRKHPFIIVTQPRRLAAITLCKRVSEELGVAVGQECGFAIGQDAMRSDSTRLLFVTTGWLTTKVSTRTPIVTLSL